MKHAFAVIAAALLVVLVNGRIVSVFDPQPNPPPLFGVMGITPGDTMQLNVVNVGAVRNTARPLQSDTQISG